MRCRKRWKVTNWSLKLGVISSAADGRGCKVALALWTSRSCNLRLMGDVFCPLWPCSFSPYPLSAPTSIHSFIHHFQLLSPSNTPSSFLPSSCTQSRFLIPLFHPPLPLTVPRHSPPSLHSSLTSLHLLHHALYPLFALPSFNFKFPFHSFLPPSLPPIIFQRLQ